MFSILFSVFISLNGFENWVSHASCVVDLKIRRVAARFASVRIIFSYFSHFSIFLQVHSSKMFCVFKIFPHAHSATLTNKNGSRKPLHATFWQEQAGFPANFSARFGRVCMFFFFDQLSINCFYHLFRIQLFVLNSINIENLSFGRGLTFKRCCICVCLRFSKKGSKQDLKTRTFNKNTFQSFGKKNIQILLRVSSQTPVMQ